VSRNSYGLSISTFIAFAIGIPSLGTCQVVSSSPDANATPSPSSPKSAASSIHKFVARARSNVGEFSCVAPSSPEAPELRLDEIKVYSTVDPADFEAPSKSQLVKFREFLDVRGKSRVPVFKESVSSDGTRTVRVTTSVRTYWIDEVRGQVDAGGINQSKVATNCWGGCK
jgi:hypothetical protein